MELRKLICNIVVLLLFFITQAGLAQTNNNFLNQLRRDIDSLKQLNITIKALQQRVKDLTFNDSVLRNELEKLKVTVLFKTNAERDSITKLQLKLSVTEKNIDNVLHRQEVKTTAVKSYENDKNKTLIEIGENHISSNIIEILIITGITILLFLMLKKQFSKDK